MELPHDEPIAKLNIDGEEYVMHRFNSALFTHLGELAVYDHIFVQVPDEVEVGILGSYIFKHNEVFEELTDWMVQNEFPMHLNLTEVADCDKGAFDKTVELEAGDLDMGVPEAWG